MQYCNDYFAILGLEIKNYDDFEIVQAYQAKKDILEKQLKNPKEEKRNIQIQIQYVKMAYARLKTEKRRNELLIKYEKGELQFTNGENRIELDEVIKERIKQDAQEWKEKEAYRKLKENKEEQDPENKEEKQVQKNTVNSKNPSFRQLDDLVNRVERQMVKKKKSSIPIQQDDGIQFTPLKSSSKGTSEVGVIKRRQNEREREERDIS